MFRFSIRELMLVTLVVAMGTGWFCHWMTLQRCVQEQTMSVEAARGRFEAMESLLTLYGFEIREEGNIKYYWPPPSLRP